VPTGRWRETLELDARHEGDEDRLLLTPGLYFKPRKAFEIGVGIPIGLTQRSSDVARWSSRPWTGRPLSLTVPQGAR
jgi:hypothetical protein